MARKTVVTICDDIDGGPADETVRFAFDGVDYEIDLSSAHAGQLRAGLADFVAAARRATRATTRPAATRPPRSPVSPNQRIRDWALKAGVTVSDRGRISQTVLDAYRVAGGR